MRPLEIEDLIISKQENDRKNCIPLLTGHLEKSPGDVDSWYDLACCYDFMGKEIDAEPNYLKVYELGPDRLSPRNQLGYYVGYGSTLRNNKKYGESEKILRQGIEKFPRHAALKIFLGFTLHSNGEFQSANEVLLQMASDLPATVVDGYDRAIKWYSENLNK